MTLGHARLDVHPLSIGYVAWVYEKAKGLNDVHRPARDRWLRASHREDHTFYGQEATGDFDPDSDLDLDLDGEGN